MAGMRRNPLTARRTGRPQNASVSGGASFSDFSELFGMGAPVASGQVVTPESAMRFSAVFACVRLLGGAVASAPVKVYLREGTEQRQLAHGHPLADVLRLRPNRFMTSTTFWKTFVAHKVLQGNGYAHIIRERSGEPVGLYPLNPRNVVVYWAWELGLDQRLGVERNRLFYRVTFEDGQAQLYDHAARPQCRLGRQAGPVHHFGGGAGDRPRAGGGRVQRPVFQQRDAVENRPDLSGQARS